MCINWYANQMILRNARRNDEDISLEYSVKMPDK